MVKTVDAGAGINWLQGGWAAFKSGGPLLIGMVFVSLLLVLILRLVPWFGALLAPHQSRRAAGCRPTAPLRSR